MTFPDRTYGAVAQYFDAYAEQLDLALASVSRDALDAAQNLLVDAIAGDAQIFSCGNGGSAAISNHLVCDHTKGLGADSGLKARVQSLSANVEVMT
ncbi:MAG: SIS domain-containing protein, partial [Magnetospirillum sp.]|nr:SIS domain-containing protein [Magnetospirillum sp.]